MTHITFIEHDGTRHEVEAIDGISIMQAAVDNMVPGIVGDCGGCCSCATCHAYIEPAFMDRIEPAAADECDLLEGALDVQACSRLTCQVKVSAALEGVTIRMPQSQY
jgi:2Fe-2S ferredoxin